MRQHLLTAGMATLLFVASPAIAQDIDWTGLYVGGTLGGSWGDTSTKTNANPGGGSIVIPPADLAAINATDADSSNDTGFTGGIEAGINYQFGALMVGLETDYTYFNIDQDKRRTVTSAFPIVPPAQFTLQQDITTDWMWTLRPRIGYAAGPWLFYATGGIATTKIEYSVSYSDTRTTPTPVTASFDDTKTGWTAGLGGAYAFTEQWSVKAEYLYADFGNIRGSFATPTDYVDFTSEAEVKANLFRVGVDFTF